MYYLPAKTPIYGSPATTKFANSKRFVIYYGGYKEYAQNSTFFLTVDVHTPTIGFHPSPRHTLHIFQKYPLSGPKLIGTS